MFRSYRTGYIAAIVYIALTTLGQAQEKTQNEQGQATTQQEPSKSLPFSIPIHIVEDKTATEARKTGEYKTSQREIEDLIAQQGMNSATQMMAQYAYWSTILVGFGTVLLIITLWLTRQANRAAQAAVEVTREIGEAQVRAYLTISSINAWYATVQVNQKITKKWSIEFKLRNSGHTPARNIWCKVDIITPRAEASGDAVVAFDISGNSDGMFEVRCDVNQSGDAFKMGLVDSESFNLECRVTVGFTDVFDKSCGPFNFLFGATKNFSRHGRGNGLLPIHEAGA